MRIALAGISHETNTYCGALTPYDAFHTYRGAAMLATAGQESDVGGAVDACRALQIEAVPILYASTQPSGTIERAAYEAFKEEILQGLSAAGKIDGCVLLLHGAGVVEGIADLEGDLAAAVRALVGDLPIAASFDLHGNVTRAMADQLNGIFVCRQYPHIDLHEQARAAVEHVHHMALSGHRARCEVTRLPMLLPTTTTFGGIGQEMLNRLLALESESDCVNLSWFHGFPYTDIPHIGSYVALTSFQGELVDARAAVQIFAQELWSARERFIPESLDGDAAVKRAQEYAALESDGPVVIHETSDNCGGGTPGDGTHLLRSMMAAGLGAEACFAFIVDAEAAQEAHRAGVGTQIRVELGGKTDDLHGEPLRVEAYVKALHDGRLVMQHMFKGAPLNIGPMARLVIDDMDVVVASRRSQTFDQEPFLAVGIDVKKYKYVALKSSNHFRAGFQHLAGAIVTADTPGLTTHNIGIFPRQQTARRLWPIDPSARFPED